MSLTGELILNLVNILIVSIASFIHFLATTKFYKMYQEDKATQPLLFTLITFFVGLGEALIAIEKFYFSIALNESAG